MSTTRVFAQWTVSGSTSGRPALDTLAYVAGDFAADYDLEGAEADFLSRINMGMPPGFTMARNGELFGPADSTWIEDNFVNPEEVDLLDGIEDVDVYAILERHERTPKTNFERAQQLLIRFVDELLPHIDGELARRVRAFRTLVEKGGNPDAAVAVALTFDEHAQGDLTRKVIESLEYAAERLPYIRREVVRAAEDDGQLLSLRDNLDDAEGALYELRKV